MKIGIIFIIFSFICITNQRQQIFNRGLLAKISIGTFRFMQELYDNNRREWFDANRKQYEQFVKQPMKELAEDLIGPVASVIPDTVQRYKISRINNDIRFSPDRPPYKEHMWISFGGGGQCKAEMFAGIGRDGWATGCGIGGNKREDLDIWRINLLNHAEIWRSYCKHVGFEENFMVYSSDSYKKPLFENIPADMFDLVQAKSLWIINQVGRDFSSDPAADFFHKICNVIPTFIFMTVSKQDIVKQLSMLSSSPNFPDEEIGEIRNIIQQ